MKLLHIIFTIIFAGECSNGVSASYLRQFRKFGVTSSASTETDKHKNKKNRE